MKIDVEDIKALEPGKVYAIEVPDIHRFQLVMELAEMVRKDSGINFIVYIKGDMRFMEPKEVDEIVNRTKKGC